MDAADPASLVPLIEAIRSSIDTPSSDATADHAKLLAQINNLLLAAEAPTETVFRIIQLPWQNACVMIGCDLGIFETLSKEAEKGVNAASLAQKTGADETLLGKEEILCKPFWDMNRMLIEYANQGRVMRMLVAMGLCTYESEVYKANSKTALMVHGSASYQTIQVGAKLPQYLKERSYKNPSDPSDSPFIFAFGEPFWTWLRKEGRLARYGKLMASGLGGRSSVISNHYPVEETLLQGTDGGSDEIALVDVGGSRGHDLVKIRNKYPNLRGKLVLQDLPDVIASCDPKELEGITTMPHDFFTPQPIIGARAYHFRGVFHDWPDMRVREILQQTIPAMKPGYSMILISDHVLVDNNPGLFGACFDFTMMGMASGMERSKKQWHNLLESVNLRIVKITQVVEGGEGVIEAVLRD